jgi:hypothetical protein
MGLLYIRYTHFARIIGLNQRKETEKLEAHTDELPDESAC